MNPRTASRELVTGIVSIPQALGLLIASSAAFILTTWFINRLAFALSPVALVILFLYSFTKRFSSLTHFFLGLALVYDRRRLPVRPTGRSGGETQPEKWPMVVFILLNLGLPLAILGQPGLMIFGGSWLGAVAAFGALLQLFAGLVFVYDLWRGLLSER